MNFVKRGVFLIGSIIVICVLFVFQLTSVYGIGISGNNLNVILDFEPGLEREFSYDVLVTNPDISNYEAFAVDDIARYFRVEPRYLKFDKENPQVLSFTAFMKLPEDEREIGPGKHCAGLGANEMTTEEDVGGALSISTRTSAKARVCINVLYPGKYAEGVLHVPNGNEGETIQPYVDVTSGGKEDIEKVSAEIMIYDLNGTELKRMQTNSEALPVEGKAKLVSSFETVGMAPGNYRANAIMHYDGTDVLTGETRFMIGSLNVIIKDYPKQLIQGKINKFEIKVENKWNSRIDDVYARVIVGNQDVKSLPISIESWTEDAIPVYVDAHSFELGTMPIKIIIFYADKKTVEDGFVEIIRDPEGDKFRWFSNLNMTIILIIILIILVESIWIISKKLKKDEKNKK